MTIPSGGGVKAIASRLEKAGVIDHPFLFRVVVQLQRQSKNLKAGEYRFDPYLSMEEVLAKLVAWETVLYQVTIPEGLSRLQIKALLQKNEILSGDVTDLPPEGYLLCDSYRFHRGDSRQSLLDRMAQNLEKNLAALWEERQEYLPLNSPEEALILASIVEKETGLSQERRLVASVFINRLRLGMRLQSDPTVIYGLTKGERPLGRGLRRSELDHKTVYNTYQIDHLPPAPIANVGRAAIAAVLQPAETDFLYFVADGTGAHVFAKTLREHNRNVAAWREIERSRK